jgi:hypothetical protein
MANLNPDPAEDLRQQVYDFTRQAGESEPLTINIEYGQQAPVPEEAPVEQPKESFEPEGVPYNPNFYTLTQEDINNNRNLKLLGAVAGDQVNPEDNKLVRNFSAPEDEVGSFTYLSQAMLDAQPDQAKRLGAEAGDVVVDGKLIKTGNSSFFKQLEYSYDTTESFFEQASKIGKMFGVYEDGSISQYPDLESRRKAINREKERELQQEYGRWFKPDEGITAANVLGSIGAAVTDPVTYLPFGAGKALSLGVKGIAAGEAGVGATYSMLQDVTSDKGEIDPAKAALYGTVGAGSVALPTIAAKGIRNYKDKKADKFVNQVERDINDHIAAGGSEIGAAKAVSKKYGDAKINAALQRTGRTFNVPQNQQAAQKYMNSLIANDPLGAASKFTNINKLFASTRTEILKRAPTVARRLDKYDHGIGVRSEAYISRAKPSIDRIQALPQSQRIHRYLLNEDLGGALKATPKALHDDVRNILGIYKEIGQELLKAGNKFTLRDVYAHRYVKDYDGLLDALGTEKRSDIRRALQSYADKKGIARTEIDPEIRDKIANQVIRGLPSDAAKAGLPQTKERVVDITEDLMPYYGNMSEAFEHYVRTSVTNMEKSKLFGKGTAGKDFTDVDEDGVLNVGQSIGNLLADLEEKGLIKGEAVDDVTKMLNARLGNGERGMNSTIGVVRDIGYASTIANPLTAAIQLTDLAASGAFNGFRNTIAAAFDVAGGATSKALGGKDGRLIKMVDMGIHDAAAEMSDMTKSAKVLHKLFQYSGFSAIDQFAKESIANAALRKNIKSMLTPKGEARFRKQWAKYYGDEMDDVVAAHKSLANKQGKLTPEDVPDLVREHSLAELLEMQPVTRSDQPYAWLVSPNSRIMYMLKTWTLKQYDIMRRKVFDEWKRGNKYEAAKFATVYLGTMAAATGSAEMGRNLLLGRKVNPEELPDKAIDGVMGMYGFSKYNNDRYLLRGDIMGFAKNLVTPATPLFDSAGKMVADTIKGDIKEPAAYAKPVPIVGRLLESWIGGGKEKYNEQQ